MTAPAERSSPAATLAWLQLPGHTRAVGQARQFAAEVLGDGFSGLDDVLILVSELVSNAVMHTASGDGGSVALTVSVNRDLVRVEVGDQGGASAPRLADDDGPADVLTGGRGLRIVDTLATKWGFEGDESGRVVWFERVCRRFCPPVTCQLACRNGCHRPEDQPSAVDRIAPSSSPDGARNGHGRLDGDLLLPEEKTLIGSGSVDRCCPGPARSHDGLPGYCQCKVAEVAGDGSARFSSMFLDAGQLVWREANAHHRAALSALRLPLALRLRDRLSPSLSVVAHGFDLLSKLAFLHMAMVSSPAAT
jgi:anti-sigma regulatory factor (Ser/Thr protein kinase)